MNFIKYIVLLALLLGNNFSNAQDFEGVIDFKKWNAKDTLRYRYYVQDVNVRIEELDKSGKIAGVMIILPKINSVRALSPERKLYMEVPHNSAPKITGKPEVIKTKITKEIAGVKCTQVRVKSVEEDTEISYWVATGGYPFFLPMINTINRKDKLSYYFLSLTDNADMFPFEADERSTKRDFRNMIKVERIERKKLDIKLFTIPADYKKYDK